ncbi:hypothetical protein EDD86DRAFT_211818 [Gorgonomyces haynaldii]|nr:hypothetical protein EDD86DRAFT_211818 [Gorgonomyces haynaldii]
MSNQQQNVVDPGLLSGYALKNCKSLTSRWVNRWIRLAQHEFTYSHEPGKEIKWTLALVDIDKVEMQIDQKNAVPFQLILKGNEFTAKFGFPNLDELRRWATAIEKQKNLTWNKVGVKSLELTHPSKKIPKNLPSLVIGEKPQDAPRSPQTPQSPRAMRPSVGVNHLPKQI